VHLGLTESSILGLGGTSTSSARTRVDLVALHLVTINLSMMASQKGGNPEMEVAGLDICVSCGEGQTERRACALFTEREVSFRVEASVRTMTKESS
jgi:hypothetical protein